MTIELRASLCTKLDESLADNLLASYVRLVAANRTGQPTECLREAGIFVELTFIALEFLRTAKVLKEIRNVSALVSELSKDSSLPDQFRVIMPRYAQAMYEVRSKRGAVHQKEIDPQGIDAAICASTASWIISEFIRNFHSSDETLVAEAMASLMNVQLPLLETLGGETVVTTTVPVGVELLLLAGQQGATATRKSIGAASKYAPPRVTEAIKKHEDSRYLHKSADGVFHLTAPGQKHLMSELSRLSR